MRKVATWLGIVGVLLGAIGTVLGVIHLFEMEKLRQNWRH